MNGDWALSSCKSGRVRTNFTTFLIAPSSSLWHPGDATRILLSGGGKIQWRTGVLKTGWNSGNVDLLLYSHVWLNEETTIKDCIVASRKDAAFSMPGDSGAAVVDESGRLVGLILGGTEGKPTELVGYSPLVHIWVSYVTRGYWLRNQSYWLF